MNSSGFSTLVLILNIAVSESTPARRLRSAKVKDLQPRLVAPATQTPFPAIAFIEFLSLQKQGGQIISICTGSLISRRHILTAAHCITEGGPLIGIRVTLGRQSLSEAASKKTTYEVKLPLPKNVIPGGWTTPGCTNLREKTTKKKCFANNAYDVAILTLDREVKLSADVQPVCIDRSYNGKRMTKASSFGWKGSARNAIVSGRLASTSGGRLRKLNMQAKTCQSKIFSGNLCSYEAKGRGSEDGDSGGPLARFSNNKWKLIGDLSIGDAVDPREHGQFVIFTDLTSPNILSFVEKATGGAAC